MVDSNIDQWSSMFPDILESISDHLPLADFFAFRRVCSRWRRAPSGRAIITRFSKHNPWLMFYGINDHHDTCYFYSNSYCCNFRLPGLQGATIVESKFGWFLAHRDGNFFFYNPFSLQKIDIGKHPIVEDQACTFSRNPTCSTCTIHIVSKRNDQELEIASRKIDEKEWIVQIVTNKIGRMLRLYSCECANKDWVLFFEYSVFDNEKEATAVMHGLHYSRAGNSWVWSKVSGFGRMRIMSPVRDLDVLRDGDWVYKFGARGISVSSIRMCCCCLGLKISGCVAEIVEMVDGEESNRNLLKIGKAAWI